MGGGRGKLARKREGGKECEKGRGRTELREREVDEKGKRVTGVGKYKG